MHARTPLRCLRPVGGSVCAGLAPEGRKGGRSQRHRHACDSRGGRCRAGLSHVRVMAKICTPEAMLQAKAIIAAADGVVLGRGTLGLELPAEKVFYAQKACLRAANLAGKARALPTPCATPHASTPSGVRAWVACTARSLGSPRCLHGAE